MPDQPTPTEFEAFIRATTSSGTSTPSLNDLFARQGRTTLRPRVTRPTVTPTNVLSTHIHPVADMPRGRTRIRVRVIQSRMDRLVGQLMTTSDVMLMDRNARGVLVSYAGSRPDRLAMVHEDPGSGPYQIIPEYAEVYPEHLYSVTNMEGDELVRVIFSDRADHVGQIMPSSNAYSSGSNTLAVIIRDSVNYPHGRVYPDPGPGPYDLVGMTAVPRGHVTSASNLPGGEAARVRVISSRTSENVGRVMFNIEAYRSDSRARVVLLHLNNDLLDTYQRGQFEGRIFPDPGEGPYMEVPGNVPPRNPLSRRVAAPPCDTCGKRVSVCRCTPCNSCSAKVDRRGEQTVRLGWPVRYYHAGCVTCNYCRSRPGGTDLVRTQDGGRHSMYCSECRHRCANCNSPEFWLSPGSRLCVVCAPDETGVILGSDEVQGYRHTPPNRWLGGPLPRTKGGHQIGFYIGFELEVSSRQRYGGDVSSLRQWSQDNLGYRDGLDIKTDSSVQGFEIASQPMTPEFFESIDWASFMTVLDRDHRTTDTSESKEPEGHGLHVHIGRVAFDRDDVATAMFCYLIGQGNHLERIGRRRPTNYCRKIAKPTAAAVVNHWANTGLGGAQARRLQRSGVVGTERGAINLNNEHTIEIRAFRSTRDAEHLKNAVRLVYLAARYVAHLRGENRRDLVSPKALHWSAFMAWVKVEHPDAVAGLEVPGSSPAQPTPEQSINLAVPTTTRGGIRFESNFFSSPTEDDEDDEGFNPF